MPAAIKATLDGITTDTSNLDGTLPEFEKNSRDVQIPSCFSKITQEPGKNFPHTKQVGTYLVGKMINKGSFAKVMEGLHIPTGEKVAIKVIDKKKAKQDSYVLKNMKREPRIHQMIKHPNIVQLYETLETENSYYMVMELCLGGDLMDRICDKKKLEEREVRDYTRQIMSAVEHLHRHGIVHRDLKIENFLLDENNNIKIVDFGLSNTIKFEGLSQELLNTQCGSPAYAAPELLAHKKYGPKVDVWSIGVCTFAMLTGTLPFIVEPFNIKQLHQKMVNGEISPIPSNISSGAVHFIHSLLEPDPAKRPAVKDAIKDKWLNDVFIRKSLNSITYKNRLHPDELSPVVLNYMTETMELRLSEVINVLINNKPSSIMASYCLLLKKLAKYQKELETMKRENVIEKCDGKPPRNLNQDADIQISQKAELVTTENLNNYGNKTFPSALTSAIPDAIQEDEIAITLDNQENIPEVSMFADREWVHLEPPKSPNKNTSCEPMNQHLLDLQENLDDYKDLADVRKLYLPEKPPPTLANNPTHSANHQSQRSCTSRITPRSLTENRVIDHSPHQDTRFKDLLTAMDETIPTPAWLYSEKESPNLLMIETPQLSPLPRLRQAALRDTIVKKISCMGTSHQQTSGSPPFLVNGSRPPIFPISQLQTHMVRSLRQSKENPKTFFYNNMKIKRNLVQIKHTHKVTDLNLPVLSPPYQTRSGKKSEILRLDFA
ncbi:hormonally up-regulated neu tumor-associated kinase homolog A-like [Malaclemys terrapin pileata]|uniref:hormonally up-regulated neu tumor-associated kinase homolog A-like n=1 Tax=Malaclemys terrapin pileata TaxID=2991368 RepID=UPI0023A84CDA|nr:hormonally up-regulated neu tumor-associated kinase homolog A-like [Malaclemys terrapin pileata]